MPGFIMERSKISRTRWEVLKIHIMKQREKQKQEQEADAEEERRRKEREIQRKESAMSLEETKDELLRQESRLAELKEEKHQLFLQLKKVLNEEVTQRRLQSEKEQSRDIPLGQPTYLGTGELQLTSVSAAGQIPTQFMHQIPHNVYKVENLSQSGHSAMLPIQHVNSLKRPAPSPSPPAPSPSAPAPHQQPQNLLSLGPPHAMVNPGYVSQPIVKAPARVSAPLPKQSIPPAPVQHQPYNYKPAAPISIYGAPRSIETAGRSAFVPSTSSYYHPAQQAPPHISSASSASSAAVVVPSGPPVSSVSGVAPRSNAVSGISHGGAIYSYPVCGSGSGPYDMAAASRKHAAVTSVYPVQPPSPQQHQQHHHPHPQQPQQQHHHHQQPPSVAPASLPGSRVVQQQPPSHQQQQQQQVMMRRAPPAAPMPPSGGGGGGGTVRVPYSSPGPTSVIMRPTATMPVVSQMQMQHLASPKPAYNIRPSTAVSSSSSFQPPQQPMAARPVYAGQAPTARIHFPPTQPTSTRYYHSR